MKPYHASPYPGSTSGSVSFSLSRLPSPSPLRGDDSSFLTTPPSPTLSTRSTPSLTGHYPTSLALRDAQTGLSGLTLLHPNSPNYAHMCKSSFASTLAGPDGGKPSSPTSPTIGNPDSARLSIGQGHGLSIDGFQSHLRRTNITIAVPSSHGGGGSCGNADASFRKARRRPEIQIRHRRSRRREGGEGREREERERQIDLGSDEPGAEADMGPFPAQLSALVRLVDPKSVHALEALRGLSNPQSAKRAESSAGGGKGRKGSGDGHDARERRD
ncbi:hypothetical protein DFH11DRAFT_1790605 [Phellopilus nigrolimitatus]|nr:hypothetical protein DFH11DRAFT_1790605 [Phellopilus nigrolimitatus]